MNILQIKQLESTSKLTELEMQQVCGGDAEEHWQGYADGELDIGKTIQNDEGHAVAISFKDTDSDTVKGSIAIIDGKTYTFF